MKKILIFLSLLIISCGQPQNPKSGNTVSTPATQTEQNSAPNRQQSAPEQQTETREDENETANPASQKAGNNQDKTESPTRQNAVKPTRKFTIDETGLTFSLPASWQQNGPVSKAAGRDGKILNYEVFYKDSLSGQEITVKVHPGDNAIKLWNFHQKNFQNHKGFFNLEARKIHVAGEKALLGKSLRKFDGKGHILNPPAEVYSIVWYDKDRHKEYEIFYRFPHHDPQNYTELEKFLKSIKLK
jgi:hypothetical protein